MNVQHTPTPPKPPKKWKVAIVVWLAIYPIITLVQWLLGPQLAKITPLALRTFVMTIILVPLIVYWVLPTLQKLFASWLRK